MCRRAALSLFLVCSLAVPLSRLRGAESGGSIAGVVKDASGKPVAGATVKVRNNDRGVTVTVFSQAQGRYSATNLLPGKYGVQGLGGNFQSDPNTAVEVSGTQAVTLHLALALRLDVQGPVSSSQLAKNRVLRNHLQHRHPQEGLTGSQLAELVPDEPWRGTLISLCTDCHHTLFWIVPRRASRAEWRTSIEVMRHTPYEFYRSLEITDQQREEVADYLAKNFGPAAPPPDLDRYLPRPWVTGEAAKGVFTEYDLPPGAEPHDVAVDSQGIGWVDEGGLGAIGAFDPRSRTYSRIPIPGGKSAPTAIGVDPQDRLWFEERTQHKLVRYDPKTQVFKSWPFPQPPQGGWAQINMVRFLRDGTVWMPQIRGNQVLKFDPATEKFTQYPVPSGKLGEVQVYGMAIDKNQRVWFTERRLSNKIGALDPKTGEITEFDVPTPGANPRRMAADAEGQIWFPEYGGVGKLAMSDYRTGKITEYPTPTKYSGAYCVDVDKKNNLIWVNEMLADKIARFDPRTKTFVEYPLPTRYSSVRRIEVDPNRPTRIWYTALHADKVGYLEVAP